MNFQKVRDLFDFSGFSNFCPKFVFIQTEQFIYFRTIALFSFFTEMPTALDHATGLEKKELLAALAGIDDPYHNKPVIRGPSTKDNPTMVPSAFDARIIGCICKSD